MSRHTIVLFQFTPNIATRSYSDYDSVALALDGICKMFERKLRQDNPNTRNITYDVEQLFLYIDNLQDLGVLVLDDRNGAYVPRNKDWIKQKVFEHLRRQAQQ
eukprot:TRINITY_DN1286_c0_g1_i1.p1 TRINITY_DN1286_c0_g1~~TRINITY_DN1286_c0_g1_i1.p1  ORF type:complete len:103 (+),score=5.19 TRINITY_DN1286_c0_g1_i1:203-511(+)